MLVLNGRVESGGLLTGPEMNPIDQDYLRSDDRAGEVDLVVRLANPDLWVDGSG